MAHFLKRLELSGFKSFAQRTVLDFPAGITAIVGPNGSGKSNVVDAIRWLLGEREAKNLRGAKVEDLIFAGTVKRPRVGQAQASLHFENKNKFFPVDFAEVAVMRQVSRDGASRYFLNKSEILLRDLIDFFAKARLGSRGLVVVTQGNSDVFVQASPEARREMVEEILGLREYQIKKGDAERRLKNSRINLDKVKALVEEILPHLRSLRRQTSRWEKRGVLEEELRELENQFFGSQLGEISDELSELQKRIGAEDGKLAVLEKERTEAEARQKQVEAGQPKERKDLEEIKNRTQELLERKSALQKELGSVEAKIELSQSSGAALFGQTPARLVDLVRRIKDILESSLAGDMVEIREAIRSVLEEIEDVLGGEREKGKSEPPQGLKSQFEKVNRDLALLGREMEDLKQGEKSLEKNQEQFYQAFKSAVAAVEAAKDKIEEWKASNRENTFAKERLELRREELVRQIVQAGRDLKEFALAKHSLAGDDLAQVEKRIFKLRGDLASIGEIDEALMKEAKETEIRYQFLTKESEDLEKAVADLKKLIDDLSEKIVGEFNEALVKINEEFSKFFNLMFGGGHARLRVMKREIKVSAPADETKTEEEEVPDRSRVKLEDEDRGDGGMEIEIKLPRKKINSLEMLSGGERSLVGIAALFALISVSPPPFLVLDEIDAALDDRNTRRFAEMLKEFSKKTQFVVVTHNRATMEAADVLYGITLDEDGTSRVLSLKLE